MHIRVATAVAKIMVYNNFPYFYPAGINNGSSKHLGTRRNLISGDDIINTRYENVVAALMYTMGIMIENKWGYKTNKEILPDGTSAESNKVILTFRSMG